MNGCGCVAGSAGDALPSLKIYSKWASPPYPPGWGAAELLDYAMKQVANEAWYMERAKMAAMHLPGYPVQSFLGEIDGVFEAHDTGVVALLDAVRFGAGKAEVAAVMEKLSAVFRQTVNVVATAMQKASSLGYELGYDEGYEQGRRDREDDTNSLMDWLKQFLGAGAGMAVAFVGLALAAMFLMRGR